jgi:hypothetical protein
MRIILVYNGDRGLGALLLDVVKKAVGREDCPLCEITYSPVGKRRAWAACEARLGIPVEERHRNDLPAAWGITELPCILGRNGEDPPFVILTRAEIAACRGSVEALARRLDQFLGS